MASGISAELSLEIKSFLDGIKKSQAAAKDFSSKGAASSNGWSAGLKKVAAGMATAAAAAAAAGAAIAAAGGVIAGALAAGLKSAFDLGGKFSDIGAMIGSTAGKAQVLASAFEANGMSAEAVGTTVNKMSKSINDGINGLSTAKRAFDALGLSAEDLANMDPTDAFTKITAGLQGIENETIRTGVAMDIFGRSGGKLNVLLADPKAMENAAAMIGGQAALLDEHAADFDRVSDVLAQMGKKTQGFFVGVGSRIIDALMPVIEYINAIDLTGIGERFGDALMNALNIARGIFEVFSAMSLGEIASLFGIALRLGISKAINFLASAGYATFAAIIAYFIEGFKNVIAFLGVLTTLDFWSGMLAAFMGIAQKFASFLLKHVSNLVKVVNDASEKLTGKRALGDAEGNLAAMSEGLDIASADNLAKAGVDLGPAFAKMGERMRATGKAMGEAFTKTFNESADIIDTSDDESAINAVSGEIARAVKQLNDATPKKTETGAAGGGDEGAGKTDAGLPALNSRLAGALNTIAGRSANAVIAAEASKTSQNTKDIAKHTEAIAKNTANNGGGSKPQPKPATSGGKFA